MDEYISREETAEKIKSCITAANDAWESGYNTAMAEIIGWIKHMPIADVQPLSVVAEHIKNRLYETAYNTTEEKARNAIADMAGRIDFWINELKGGDAE